MHQLATSYKPSNPDWKRPDWNDPVHHEVEAFIPESEEEIRQLYRETIQQISKLPVDRNAWGLIHQDAHRGNFFMDDQGKITFLILMTAPTPGSWRISPWSSFMP